MGLAYEEWLIRSEVKSVQKYQHLLGLAVDLAVLVQELPAEHFCPLYLAKVSALVSQIEDLSK